MKLIVYGSFNCPYSFLASRRVNRLTEAGRTEVEWRAVVHDPDVPESGLPVSGELAEMFDRELGEIRDLLVPGEVYPARRPAVQPNTTRAVAGYCAATGDDADRLRAALFDAFWVGGLDIGDPAVLAQIGCPQVSATATMQRWHDAWRHMERPMVPMMVLSDGAVSRGLGTLKRLAALATGGSAA